MSGCGNCCGSCGSCGELILSEGEISILHRLAQIPFLPVARRTDSMDPVFLEDSHYTPESYSLFLQCLEKRELISIDYDQPLSGFDWSAYAAFPVHGSFALTLRGQQVLELMDIQGI